MYDARKGVRSFMIGTDDYTGISLGKQRTTPGEVHLVIGLGGAGTDMLLKYRPALRLGKNEGMCYRRVSSDIVVLERYRGLYEALLVLLVAAVELDRMVVSAERIIVVDAELVIGHYVVELLGSRKSSVTGSRRTSGCASEQMLISHYHLPFRISD